MDKENQNEPNTVDEILRKVEEKADTREYIYRGESRHFETVSSNLYRVFLERKDFDVEAEHFDIEIIQKDMLNEAKKYLRRTGSDCELLVEMQHYGGKTNLIDFTTDCFVQKIKLPMLEYLQEALDPDYTAAYYNRAMAWLYQQEWKEAKASLADAVEKGINITAVFGNDYQSIANFEKKIDSKLPRDIAVMLRQQEERIHISPMEENLSEFQSGMKQYSFESFAARFP